jgi:5,10-methylene-tetrahydrofolate dehydrogenase/methenyl tetrahydrofolate cyclohydrolase
MFAKSMFSRRMGNLSTSVRGFKVAVLGAGGGIGQPLSLLLKLNPKCVYSLYIA